MKLLMFGGTKFIGRAVVERALELGHEVAVFHRGETEPEGMPEILHIHGDNTDVGDHINAIKAFGPDAVIDTTQFDTPRTQAAVDALTGLVDRYVLTSSMDVYMAYGRLHRTEPGRYQPVPISEEGELRTLPGFGLTEDTDNLHIERVGLGQDKLPVTVARLPAVFGPRDYQRRIGNVIDRLRESKTESRIYPTYANFRWTWGYVENIADMLIECAMDRRPGNRVYNLGYPGGVTFVELREAVGKAIGWTGEILVTEEGTEEPEQDFTQHWIADTSKFRNDFGYSERISIKEALKLTIESVKRDGSDEHD